MITEIISITEGEFEEVETNEKYNPTYRRYSQDNWEHLFRGGWHRYMNTELLEEAYERFMRRGQQAKTVNK